MSQSLNNLAELYKSQARYAEAEPLMKRALAIKEKTLGADHPEVALCLNNLGELYRMEGRYAEAEPLLVRALESREKSLGATHPSVAQSLNSLGALFEGQGRYAEAEPYYARALTIRENTLGPDHPDLAQSLNNLAVLYHEEGDDARAVTASAQAAAIIAKHFAIGAAQRPRYRRRRSGAPAWCVLHQLQRHRGQCGHPGPGPPRRDCLRDVHRRATGSSIERRGAVSGGSAARFA